jgi:membrane protein implicated in regulation of membrane protease activity
MERVKKQAILSGMGFTATWTALTLLLSSNTWYQLVIGAIAGTAVGGVFYWLGRRLQHENQYE